MDPKKKTAWSNFRDKTKAQFGKKAKKPKGKALRYRRSISVPNLLIDPASPLSSLDMLSQTPAVDPEESYFFGASTFYSAGPAADSGSSSPTYSEQSSIPDTPFLSRVVTPDTSRPVSAAAMHPDTPKKVSDGDTVSDNFPWPGEETGHLPKRTASEPAPPPVSHSSPALAVRSPPMPVERHVYSASPSPAPTEPPRTPAAALAAAMAERPPATPSAVSKASAAAPTVPPTVPKAVAAAAAAAATPITSPEKRTPPVKRSMIPPDRLSLPADMSYWGGRESGNSTPSEEQAAWASEADLLAMMEPSTPLSREIFIVGSTEDTPYIPNESSDYDTTSLTDHQEQGPSYAGFPARRRAAITSFENFSDEIRYRIPNESSDYDTTSLTDHQEQSVHVSLTLLWYKQSVSTAGQKVQYLLTINLKEGRNLVVRDRSGTSDPFVKFRMDGKTIYKSKVVSKKLNPTWNESFSFPVRDLEQEVHVKVYDKDLRSCDFMGGCCLTLNKLELDKTTEMILKLEDPKSKEMNMGVIIIDACLTIRDGPTKRNRWMIKRKGSFGKGQVPAPVQQHRGVDMKKNQVWSGVYSVVLVEGLEMPETSQGDVYVRFRLGEQKYKSKNLCVKSNPQWREMFDFNQLDGLDYLQVEVCSKKGRRSEECWGLLDIDLSRLPVKQRQLYTRVLDPGKGRLVFLITLTPCSGASVSDMRSAPLGDPQTNQRVHDQYSLKNSLRDMKDVGFVQIKVIKASDIAIGKSEPFCVLELGNSRLQTPSLHKTLNPEWNMVFTFPIKDVHEVLFLTVYNDEKDKAPESLGKVAVPLLWIADGQTVTRQLKKDDLSGPSKGTITLEMELIYNPVRAGVRTFGPKEMKCLEDNPKFNKKILARNIYRVRRISTAILYTLQYIKSCFQWENTRRSIAAFLIFVLTVWMWELFMLPLFLLLLIGWNYFQNTPGTQGHTHTDLEPMSVAEDEDEDEKESEKKGLMDKIHMVQEIVLTVQSTLDEVASVAERIKNTFNWSVPFMSTLACVVFFLSTAALYYIPLRYIILIWGVNKFTKRLRNPYAIDSNEVLDFLQRVPSDVQKVQYSEPRAPAATNAQRKKR
ncbi:multiple C2 and transmembrane domain-containing protein 2 [Engraulis encrasicolus]|uniref:multiple C2 and transmembrane domain-containing protein 2 n=1 Tax=Engraulis encrasicolus TaxID=184585 RepID=UPI002FD5C436